MTWVNYLDSLSDRIRQLYPDDAQNKIAQGESAFLKSSPQERFHYCLQGQIFLRMCLLYRSSLSEMEPVAEDVFQCFPQLFALDDLLRKMREVLKGDINTASKPGVERQELLMVTYLQYQAESVQVSQYVHED